MGNLALHSAEEPDDLRTIHVSSKNNHFILGYTAYQIKYITPKLSFSSSGFPE